MHETTSGHVLKSIQLGSETTPDMTTQPVYSRYCFEFVGGLCEAEMRFRDSAQRDFFHLHGFDEVFPDRTIVSYEDTGSEVDPLDCPDITDLSGWEDGCPPMDTQANATHEEECGDDIPLCPPQLEITGSWILPSPSPQSSPPRRRTAVFTPSPDRSGIASSGVSPVRPLLRNYFDRSASSSLPGTPLYTPGDVIPVTPEPRESRRRRGDSARQPIQTGQRSLPLPPSFAYPTSIADPSSGAGPTSITDVEEEMAQEQEEAASISSTTNRKRTIAFHPNYLPDPFYL